jgi:hypothetical protein
MLAVRSSETEQLSWVIQPLLDAGLGLGDIRHLLFGLGFEGIVGGGAVTVGTVHGLVGDRPSEVRTAWAQTVGRLLALHEPARGAAGGLPRPRSVGS